MSKNNKEWDMPAVAMTMKKPAISFTQKSQHAKAAEIEENKGGASDATDWFDTPEGIAYLKSIFDKDEQELGEVKFYSMDGADAMMRAHIAETHKKFGLD